MLKTKCFRDAMASMNPRDVDAIEQGVQARVQAGAATVATVRAAEIGAVNDVLAEIQRERAEILRMVGEQYPGATADNQPDQSQSPPQTAQATHADPGEAPETATKAVVTEAVQKAAQNRGRKPSEMRAELLRMVDEAILEAPDYQAFLNDVQTYGEKDAREMYARGRRLGSEKFAPDGYSRPTRTFKVPGDGTFTVNNTVGQLMKFRRAVETSPGFADRPSRFVADREPTVERGSATPKTAVSNMIDEGDPQAAVDYAAARGLDIAEVLKGDKVRLPKVAGLTPTDAEAVGEFEPEASLPDLIAAYKTAEARERALADAKNVNLSELDRAVDATRAARAPLVAKLAEQPALSAMNGSGLRRIVAGSAQKPGQWQLTRFDQNGEPWGDSQYSSQEAAIDDFLQEVDIDTLEMGDAEPAAPAQPAPASASPPAQQAEPAPVSSREGQMNLANRGSRIASLMAMNNRLRQIAPELAWADTNIENASNAELDRLQDQISAALLEAQRGPAPVNPLRAELEAMSGTELRDLMGRMGLAGKLMTAGERVDALLAEDPAEVRAAMQQAEPSAPAPAERPDIAAIRRDATLDKQTSENGEVMTRRQWVERKVAEGLKPRIEQEDRIKPMSRMAYFRATNEEQRAHERKIKEAGKKDVYWIGDYEVTKTEHDYAVSLATAAPAAAEPPTLKQGADSMRREPEEGEKAPAASPAAAPGVVENFGEALQPARRNMAAKLTEDLADDDIATRPLSTIWPLAENDAIEDVFAAAVAHAARAEIPAKPRVAYKLRTWVVKVKTLRGMAGKIVSGQWTKGRMAEKIANEFTSLRDWWSKVTLLEQIDREQWKRIGSVEERPQAHTYKGGKEVPAPMLRIEVDGKSKWLTGDAGVEGEARGTIAGNMAGVAALLETAKPEQRMAFEIRGSTTFKVNKKGDPEYRPLMTFATVAEARKAITEQYDSLVAAWEAVKARDNITERDLRSAENRPRVGKDYRKGRDITVDEFQSVFGFRGGEFGKWVQQGKGDKERQALLNNSYDALMDLADIIGVPPRALSLNGTLGIAFGSRGSGWASAHFEPSNLVINLTKTRGAGTLAHEWLHAADNYFARMRRGGQEAPFTGDQSTYRNENYITHRPEPLMVRKDRSRAYPAMTLGQLQARREYRKSKGPAGFPPPDAYDADKWERDPSTPEGVRPEVEARFADLVKALAESPMAKRAALLDKSNSGYWTRTLEMAARAFESYVIAKMHEHGYHNDFLVNVKKLDETGKSDARYPYLLAGEVKPIAEAFDALFGTIQTRADDAGNVAMFSRAPAPDTETFRKWFAGSKVVDAEGKPLVVYHGTRADFSEFSRNFDGEGMSGEARNGFFFTSDPAEASDYAAGSAPGGRVMPVYVALKRPAVFEFADHGIGDIIDADGEVAAMLRKSQSMLARLKGTDGLMLKDIGGVKGKHLVVAFRPEQIKSATGNRGTFDPQNPDIRFSRASATATKLNDVQQTVDTITATWASPPEVRVVWDLQDPAVDEEVRAEDARQRRNGATGVPKAFYFRGKVYVVASAAGSEADVAKSLFHEALGHAGLRAAFGGQLKPILSLLAKTNRAAVEAKARAYGMDMNDEAQRLRAAEEVLAELAETRPTSTWVQKAIAAIRTWLRDNLPEIFGSMKMSDAEIIRNFIVPARDAIVRGREAQGRDAVPRFMRVWHGTPYRGIEKFSTDKIGTGEGAQAYGWGLYFSGRKEIAEHYRRTLSEAEFNSPGGPVGARTVVASLAGQGMSANDLDAIYSALVDASKAGKSIEAVAQAFQTAGKQQLASATQSLVRAGFNTRPAGQLYEVEIPEDSEMLLWDKPLSEQPAGVREKIESVLSEDERRHMANWRNPSWADGGPDAKYEDVIGAGAIYRRIAAGRGSQKEASLALLAAGIKGIKYLDGTSRGTSDGTYNYVIFDGADTEITGAMFSRSAADAIREVMPQAVQDRLTDAFTSQRGFNRWWHRTVGTQLHKAKIDKEFGRVYYAVQDFMKDVSRIATRAADQAPDLLPQIETLKEIFKAPPKKADMQAASAALFDGTLRYKRNEEGEAVLAEADELGGLVWTDQELRSRGVSKAGVKLYRQARAAINASLDSMLAADIYRMVSASDQRALAGNDMEADALLARIRKAAASDDPRAAVRMVSAALQDRIDLFDAQLDANDIGEQAETVKKLREKVAEALQTISDKVDRINSLKEAGYAPLMRFGQYTVDVLNDKSERVFFGMYETQMAANEAARKFREQGLIVSQGVQSKREFELLKGLSPETAKLFAELLGVEQNEAMQEWLKNAVAEQSALKRHIRRKGIEGFDDDSSRVVAAFLTSNARAASRALHSQRVQDAVASVTKGDVKDEAIALAEYVNNPKEEAQAIRSLLFVQYIGGSVASAAVNLTQTFVQTFPFLAQYGGAGKAGKRIAAAMRAALGKIDDNELNNAIRQAEKDGVIKPQEVFQLQAEASRSLGSNIYVRKGLAAWGAMFQLAEQYNRRVAFIAAYQTAKEEGIADPFAFAENAVDETQSVFNKGNRPNWSRGAVGATLFTFKTFTIQYLEFLSRLPMEQRLLALAVLVLLSGAKGLPFGEDAEDIVDTIAQQMGYNWTTKDNLNRWLVSQLGQGWADFIQHGVSGISGVPLDVSQRLGMADLLPGTGVLKPSETRKENQVLEVFGVAGSAVRDVLQGEVRPLAIRNVAKALDMYDMGMYRDTRGRKITDTDAVDAALKGLGFQPSSVAREQRAVGREYEKAALYRKVKNDITERMALGRFENDPGKIAEAREARDRWNEQNPDAKITIDMPSVIRRVKEMRKSRTERFISSAPKDIRQQTAEALR